MSATLTDKERQILATAWECFDVQPKVNYSLLAEKLGYKTSASANTAFLAAKKKLLLGSGASPVKASPAPKGKGDKTKKKSAKRVKSEVEEDDGEDDLAAKKSKRTGEADEDGDDSKTEVKAEEDGDDGTSD